MHRLLAAAAVLSALALAPGPARADTNVIISGGGYSVFSHSGTWRQFHHDRGFHFRKSHRAGGDFFFHRLPRHHDRALRSLPRSQDWIQRRTLPSWDRRVERHRHRHGGAQVIILAPGSFGGGVKIVTVPGRPSFATMFERRSGHRRLVLLPPLKPGRSAFFD
jgi:hypothetical protein